MHTSGGGLGAQISGAGSTTFGGAALVNIVDLHNIARGRKLQTRGSLFGERDPVLHASAPAVSMFMTF